MNFYLPTKVFEESFCLSHHASDLARLGSSALIVTGKHAAKLCGALDDAKNVLEQNGQRFTLFQEVEENPSLETIMKGKAAGLSCGCDFILAIGGGSAMDAGKAISLMLAQPDQDENFLYSKTSHFQTLPIAAVPTTCGTGSEVTGVSVLTDRSACKKGSIPFRIYPDLALLDARYLLSLSRRQICNTAVDALCHLMESRLCVSSGIFSSTFVKEGLSLWNKCRPILSGEAEACESGLRDLLLASCFGGMAIAHTGTTIPHAMSYPATCREQIPHGRACAYYLPGYLKAAGETGCRLLPQMAGFSDADALEEFIFRICGMTADEISRDLREETAESMAKNTAKLQTSSVPMDIKTLKFIAKLPS